jgi:ribonucleoside-diphosphate reductase subunit M2
VHAESYARQIEALLDGEERTRVLNAARTMPIITRMREWVLSNSDTVTRKVTAGKRLAVAAAIEGVLFSGSFAALQWLREQNLLPGITNANEFIARDEGHHTCFSCYLIRSRLRHKPSNNEIKELFSGVIDIIDEFVDVSLPVNLIGINSSSMKAYVRYRVDCVVAEMGYTILYYRVPNPFGFMDKFNLNAVSKTNFFEKLVTGYQNPTKPEQTKLAIDQTPDDDGDVSADEDDVNAAPYAAAAAAAHVARPQPHRNTSSLAIDDGSDEDDD